MARWTQVPFDKGVVNSRDSSQLEFGELTEATNAIYKRGSRQLHPKKPWASFPHQIVGGDDNSRTEPLQTQIDLAANGPEILSFEGEKDWLMVVVDADDSTGNSEFRGAEIWFAPTDGSGDWAKSSYVIRDNEAKRYDIPVVKNIKYQVAHWGNIYILCTNYGNCVIEETLDASVPRVRRLGMYEPRTIGMSPFETTLTNGTLGEWIEGIRGPGMDIANGSIPIVGAGSLESDFVEDDIFTLFITEYNINTGEESLPIWIGGTDEQIYLGYTEGTKLGYTKITSGQVGYGFRVYFPSDFVNKSASPQDLRFRLYMKFWGNSSVVDQLLGFDLLEEIRNYNAGVPGMSLMEGAPNSLQGGTYADPSDVRISEWTTNAVGWFGSIQKTVSASPFPTVPIDNARQIFWRYRRPHCSAVGTVFNDSLCLADYGTSRYGEREDNADDGSIVETHFEQADPARSKMTYSMPGEFWSHPDAYFLNFSTRRSDAARAFHVIGNRLIAVLEDSLHAVNYIPFSGLVQNQQGRVKSTIVEGKGTVSFHASAKIATTKGEFVVWLSEDALNWTDGTGWADACPDFRPRQPLDKEQWGGARLVNDAENSRLHLFWFGEEWTFHYSPDHLKDGKMKMTGPHPYSGGVSGAAFLQGVGYRLRGSVVEWTEGNAPNEETVIHTGKIASNSPNEDFEIQMMGLTKTALAPGEKYYARADGQVRGQAESGGQEAEVEAPTESDTNYAASVNRGQSVRGRWRVAEANTDWAVGPGWLQGTVGEA